MTQPSHAELLAKLAILEERVSNLTTSVEERVSNLTTSVDRLAKEQQCLSALANRWKGGFGVILLIGGFLGWLGSVIAGRMWTH